MGDRPNKRQQRADRNRKKLLSAAMSVFSQKGYHKATLDEICRRANLAKGTIYQHFENKKGLFLGVADSRLGELGSSIAEAVEGIEDDVARIQAAISAYLQFFGAHGSFYGILIHEQSSFAKEIRERLRTKYFSHLRVFEDVLRSGMRSGRIKKMDARSATFGIVGMCNSIIFRWLISHKQYPLKREIPLILEIFLRGISHPASDKGA